MTLMQLRNRLDNRLDKLIAADEKTVQAVYQSALNAVEKELAYLDKQGELSLTKLYQRRKINQLKSELIDILSKLRNNTLLSIESSLTKTAKESYYSQAYFIDSMAGSSKKTSFGEPDESLIKTVVYSSTAVAGLISVFGHKYRGKLKELPKKENMLEDILNKQFAYLSPLLRNKVQEGLMLGKSYPDMARDAKTVFEKGYTEALRFFRTETHKVRMIEQQAAIYEANDVGVELEEYWHSTGDFRTRPDHEAINGQKKEKGYFTFLDGTKSVAPGLSGDPSQDINCRCVVIACPKGFKPTDKKVRDPVTNKNVIIDFERSYDNYVKQRRVEFFDKSLADIKTSNGIKVTGVSRHFLKRMGERRVNISAIKEALTKPEKIGRIRSDNAGGSQRFEGAKATVNVNVSNGNIIDCWITSSRKRFK